MSNIALSLPRAIFIILAQMTVFGERKRGDYTMQRRQGEPLWQGVGVLQERDLRHDGLDLDLLELLYVMSTNIVDCQSASFAAVLEVTLKGMNEPFRDLEENESSPCSRH